MSFETITTIGYGQYAPVTSGGRTFVVFYAILGLGIVGTRLGVINDLIISVSSEVLSLVGQLLNWPLLIPQRERFDQNLDRVMEVIRGLKDHPMSKAELEVLALNTPN